MAYLAILSTLFSWFFRYFCGKFIDFLESPKSMRWVGGVRCLGQSPKKMFFLSLSLRPDREKDYIHLLLSKKAAANVWTFIQMNNLTVLSDPCNAYPNNLWACVKEPGTSKQVSRFPSKVPGTQAGTQARYQVPGTETRDLSRCKPQSIQVKSLNKLLLATFRDHERMFKKIDLEKMTKLTSCMKPCQSNCTTGWSSNQWVWILCFLPLTVTKDKTE